MDDTAGVRFRAKGVRLTKASALRTLKLVGELEMALHAARGAVVDPRGKGLTLGQPSRPRDGHSRGPGGSGLGGAGGIIPGTAAPAGMTGTAFGLAGASGAAAGDGEEGGGASS
jgi:hypothetical protein